jgi:hypothetical protein
MGVTKLFSKFDLSIFKPPARKHPVQMMLRQAFIPENTKMPKITGHKTRFSLMLFFTQPCCNLLGLVEFRGADN